MSAPVDVLAPAESRSRLDPHYVEVLDLVADGLANHEIGRRLGLKPDTVATRLKAAAKILGSGDRTVMVAECYRRGVFQRKPVAGQPPEVAAHLLPLLSLLARGTTYAGCAKALGIDESMVKKRASALYRKVGARDRTALPRRAVDAGLLPPSLVLPGAAVPAPPSERKRPSLTPDQARVLRMLAFGLEVRAVATRLAVSEGSVRVAAGEVMAVLGARTLPHAVLLACQAGILPGGGRG